MAREMGGESGSETEEAKRTMVRERWSDGVFSPAHIILCKFSVYNVMI